MWGVFSATGVLWFSGFRSQLGGLIGDADAVLFSEIVFFLSVLGSFFVVGAGVHVSCWARQAMVQAPLGKVYSIPTSPVTFLREGTAGLPPAPCNIFNR